MRGVPDHSNEQTGLPSLAAMLPLTLRLKDAIPDELMALGQEVVDMVRRHGLYTLNTYRQAAKDLSKILRVNGRRIKPKDLYYVALRVKWIKDSTGE